jgi:signal transduction histidine kinase
MFVTSSAALSACNEHAERSASRSVRKAREGERLVRKARLWPWMFAFVVAWQGTFHAASLFEVAPHVSAWYPPVGVAFAFVLVFGWRLIPLLFLLVLANSDIDGLGFNLAQSLRQTLVYGGGALLLRHLKRAGRASTAFRSAIGLVVAGLATSLVSAAAAGALFLAQGTVASPQAIYVILGFWLGDATGLLVAAPLCVLFLDLAHHPSTARLPGWELPAPRIVAIQFLVVIAFTGVLFWAAGRAGEVAGVEFLLLLPTIAIAVTGGHRSVVLALPLLTAAPTAWGQVPGLNGGALVVELQIILLTNAVLGLVLGAVASERRGLVLKLLDHEAMLQERVREKTRHLEEEIARREAAQRAKARALAAASHDCRQPLQSVALALGVLGARYRSPEDEAMLAKVQAQIEGAADFLRDLMDLSRMESGTFEVRSQPVPLGRLLDRLRLDFEMLAGDKGLSLSVVSCSAEVVADPVLLERVLRNLVGNAIRYTDRGGVVVGCRRRDGRIRIDVVDTGPGIPVEERERIFEEFHRASAGHADESHGIGLAVVRHIADLLGADLDLASKIGKGSRFSLTLHPAAD